MGHSTRPFPKRGGVKYQHPETPGLSNSLNGVQCVVESSELGTGGQRERGSQVKRGHLGRMFLFRTETPHPDRLPRATPFPLAALGPTPYDQDPGLGVRAPTVGRRPRHGSRATKGECLQGCRGRSPVLPVSSSFYRARGVGGWWHRTLRLPRTRF